MLIRMSTGCGSGSASPTKVVTGVPARPDCKSLAATSKAKQNPNSVLQFRAKAIRTPANLIRLQDGLLSNDELQRAQIIQGHNLSSEETEGEVQSWTTTQPCLP
jgi:hypothetical protein